MLRRLLRLRLRQPLTDTDPQSLPDAITFAYASTRAYSSRTEHWRPREVGVGVSRLGDEPEGDPERSDGIHPYIAALVRNRLLPSWFCACAGVICSNLTVTLTPTLAPTPTLTPDPYRAADPDPDPNF